ncbi:MAG: hypothetical protein HYR90_01950 [Candidatus Andersenbacteria bacterium]|nr:hypothetical protein [Candidatus Andersenbacteria bacterium]MBI3250923.1 hypothetical protein [Candidatus Andersenbacteria bacterium]
MIITNRKLKHITSQGVAIFVSTMLVFGLPSAVFAQEETPTEQAPPSEETTAAPAEVEKPCTSGCNQGANQGVGQGGPTVEDLGGTYDEQGSAVLPAGTQDTRQGAGQGTPQAASTSADVSGSNTNTGSGSTNTAGTNVSNTQTTGITNTATDSSSIDALGNTGGNTNSGNTKTGPTTTGNASIGVTQVKNDNTAVVGGDVGLAVSGHNGDYNGDLNLDFNGLASLLAGDGSERSVQAVNNATGSNSSNDVVVSFEDISDTEVQNDGEITNDVDVAAITGQNDASRNTSGGTILTGDANIAATLVNLLNTTVLNGNVFVTVKDIFGNLTGNINIPDLGQLASFLSGGGQVGVEADNSNTGSNSSNSIDVDITDEDTFTVDNEANIDTTVRARAITGQNEASDNTGGGFIDTGDASVSASNITIANTTIEGGNWGLVIVNALNKWLGFLVGDSGEVRALSQDETIREVEARNNNTGSGSDNTIEVDDVTRDTTSVDNDADITNNITASAITGQNTANRNTGAGAIKTGNATVKATAINIANTTVKNANLGIAVVNIFGDWLGDLFYGGQSLFGANSAANTQVEVEAENENTGADSDNTVDVTVDRSHVTDITNDADISTTLETEIDTGNNRTNRNTRGGSIETGNSDLALHSRTIANLTALMDGGGLNIDVHGDNNSTGVDSKNIIRATVNDERIITVTNDANVSTILPGLVNTGNNESSDNTIGGEIESGDINAKVAVDNMVNRFILALGSPITTGTGAAAVIDGDLNNNLTGSGSLNTNDIDATRDFLRTLFNDAVVNTIIDLLFNTGGNQSNDNTGTGSTSPFAPASTPTTSAAASTTPAPYVAAIAQPLGYSQATIDEVSENKTNESSSTANTEAQSDQQEDGDSKTFMAASEESKTVFKKVAAVSTPDSSEDAEESDIVPQPVVATTTLPPRNPRRPQRLAALIRPSLAAAPSTNVPAPQHSVSPETKQQPGFPTIIVIGTIFGTLTGGAAVRRLSV